MFEICCAGVGTMAMDVILSFNFAAIYVLIYYLFRLLQPNNTRMTY